MPSEPVRRSARLREHVVQQTPTPGTSQRTQKRAPAPGTRQTKQKVAAPVGNSDAIEERSAPAPGNRGPRAPTPEDYAETRNPDEVTRPVVELVHEKMSRGWKVNNAHCMEFIFDAVNPARLFKLGTVYTEQSSFIPWTAKNSDPALVTDTDTPNATLIQFEPWPFVKRKWSFVFKGPNGRYLEWAEGELRTVTYGMVRKRKNANEYYVASLRKKEIPVAYFNIILQFHIEYLHAITDLGHEASRRRAYAMEMTNLFANELNDYVGPPADFRSYVLTPVLVRQLHGVPDAYAPTVRAAIGGGELTIRQVTEFYLSIDPVEAAWIPNYRRNLLLISEVRWMLCYLRGRCELGDPSDYNKIRDHTYDLLSDLKDEPIDTSTTTDDGMPLLSWGEVRLICREAIQGFYVREIDCVPETFEKVRTLEEYHSDVDSDAPPPSPSPEKAGSGGEAKRTTSEQRETQLIPPQDAGEMGPTDGDVGVTEGVADMTQEDIDMTQGDVNPTPEVVNPNLEDVNPTQEDVNPTQEDVNPTQEDVNPTQEDVNPTLEDPAPAEEDVDMTQENIDPPEDNGESLPQKVPDGSEIDWSQYVVSTP